MYQRDGKHRHAIRPRRCKSSALSGENGRGRGARTPDLRFWRPPLYQLSYTPIRLPHPKRTARYRQGMASLRRGGRLGKPEKCIFYNKSVLIPARGVQAPHPACRPPSPRKRGEGHRSRRLPQPGSVRGPRPLSPPAGRGLNPPAHTTQTKSPAVSRGALIRSETRSSVVDGGDDAGADGAAAFADGEAQLLFHRDRHDQLALPWSRCRPASPSRCLPAACTIPVTSVVRK
jgi:hypothetical protein